MKKIISGFLALLLLLAITAGGLSAQVPEPELWYPFFRGDGRPCSAYSTIVSTGAGQVAAYDDAQMVCFWVSSVKFYDVSAGAEISFVPSWCPDVQGGSFMMDFWEIPEDVYPGGNEAFWVGYPLPAGLGTLRVGSESWYLYLAKGENVLHLP